MKDALVLEECAKGIVEEAERLNLDPLAIGPVVARVLEPVISPQKPAKARESIQEVALDDISNLAAVALRQSKDPIFAARVAIRTVFGASEEMPIRALGYILPALHFVEGLRRSDKYAALPQIQFIFMENVGSSLNGFDIARVKSQTSLFIRLAKRYIKEYYPELKKQIVFATDSDFLADGKVRELASSLYEDSTVEQDPLYQAAIAGLSHNGNVKAYTLLHPLVHDVRFEGGLFRDTEGKPFENNPTVLVNIGGQREKQFYRARQAFRKRLEDIDTPLQTTIQFFSSHKVPPYIRLDKQGDHSEDLSLEQAIRQPDNVTDVLYKKQGEDNLLRRDIDLLVEDTFGIYAFEDFLRRCGSLL